MADAHREEALLATKARVARRCAAEGWLSRVKRGSMSEVCKSVVNMLFDPLLAEIEAEHPAGKPSAGPDDEPSGGPAGDALRSELETEGFSLVPGVLSREDVQAIRNEMLMRRREIDRRPLRRFLHRLVNPTGVETVEFMTLRDYYAATCGMVDTPRLLDAKLRPWLAKRFGADADFFFHNDVGLNHLSRWHKDRLNNNLLGRYRDDYEALDPWEEGPYDIYKCLIYLQDHGGPHGVGPALDVIPGSHRAKPVAAGEGATLNSLAVPAAAGEEERAVSPMMGDLILFDQRLTHRGHAAVGEVRKILRSFRPSRADGSDARILVTVGFGLRSSKHLPGFREGTLARQAAVFFLIEKVYTALELLLLVGGARLAAAACRQPGTWAAAALRWCVGEAWWRLLTPEADAGRADAERAAGGAAAAGASPAKEGTSGVGKKHV